MAAFADALGRFLAPILVPLIKQALAEFFRDSAEFSKPNKELSDEAAKAFDGRSWSVFNGGGVRDPGDRNAPRNTGDPA